MKPTTRSVLYIGYQCNASCVHCYFKAKKWDWRPLADITADADRYRTDFGDDRCDITGGEPSIHPRIASIVDHCRSIGLRPSMITNALAMNEAKVSALVKAGLHDCLVSVHGLEDTANAITGRADGFEKQEANIAVINNAMPWRSNTCILKQSYKQLPEIAAWLAARSVGVMNFIAFNPYFEWKAQGRIDCQVQHSEAAPYVMRALDVAREAGIPARVRYMPFCMLPGYEDHVRTWHQLPYDPHEWNIRSWLGKFYGWNGDENLQAMTQEIASRTSKQPGTCENFCSMSRICDGLSVQYANTFGFDELQPYNAEKGRNTTLGTMPAPRRLNPCYYMEKERTPCASTS